MSHPGVETQEHNSLRLTGVLVQMASLRYTPAAVPVIDLLFEHQSQQIEAGQPRQVTLQLKAVAFGPLAESLARIGLGTALQLLGFLTNARNGKGVVFHVQAFKLI